MDAELRALRWLASHEREHPDKPAKDTDLADALGLDYVTTRSLINALRTTGQVESRDFHTVGLGHYVFGVKLTLAGHSRLARAAENNHEGPGQP